MTSGAYNEEVQARADTRRRSAEEQARKKATAAQLEKLAKQAGRRFRHKRLDNFQVMMPEQKAVMERLREYVKNAASNVDVGNGLILYGPVGTGKDHLLHAITLEVLKRVPGLTVEWIYGLDWFGEIRDAMGESHRTEVSLIRPLANAGILVLSDPLPAHGALSQHMMSMLQRLVEARYRDCRPTFVSLNVQDDNEADSRLGAPTWDRLNDGASKVFCNWPSFRVPQSEFRAVG